MSYRQRIIFGGSLLLVFILIMVTVVLFLSEKPSQNLSDDITSLSLVNTTSSNHSGLYHHTNTYQITGATMRYKQHFFRSLSGDDTILFNYFQKSPGSERLVSIENGSSPIIMSADNETIMYAAPSTVVMFQKTRQNGSMQPFHLKDSMDLQLLLETLASYPIDDSKTEELYEIMGDNT